MGFRRAVPGADRLQGIPRSAVMTSPARREKDRWHQLADAIGASNLRASDKSVYRALLDRADYGTAVMQHRFTETQATIARKTSHSPRMVRYAIRHLERHGW